MNKPVMHRNAWQVFTTSEFYGFASPVSWAWVAYGPRGEEAGVEQSSDAAVLKAQVAAELLADARVRKEGAA